MPPTSPSISCACRDRPPPPTARKTALPARADGSPGFPHAGWGAPASPCSRSEYPPHRLERRGRLGAALAALGHLPERQRAALVLRELGGLSDAEIGAALAIPASGVRQAVFEARAGLKDFALGRELSCLAVRAAIADGD